MANQFGRMLDGSVVEKAAIDTIDDYIAAYLAQAERDRGWTPGEIPTPNSYSTTNRFARVDLAAQTPAVIVVSPGLADDPVAEGSGEIRAKWSLGFAVCVSANDQESVNELCKLYTSCIRTIILQKSSLGGLASGTTWIDETYDDLPPEQQRTLAVGTGLFTVEVRNVVDWKLGPAAPPSDPTVDPGDQPVVEEVHIDVVHKN